MKHLKNLILTLALFAFATISFGQGLLNQNIINQALDKETIKNQFEVLVSKSPEYQGFRNIKKTNVAKFRVNFLDTLKAIDAKFNLANTKINEQRNEIEKLNTAIATINNDLTEVTKEKDSVGLFGMRMTKGSYNFLLWSIIFGLLATTLLLLFKFKTSNKSTKLAKTSFTEIENEFELHKKNSLEREQVLRRKLQDEINKQRNSKK